MKTKVKNLIELNGQKSGVFTIIIDNERNSLAITGKFLRKDSIVYFKELDKIDEILEDIKGFGFEVELEEKRIFKILFDKELEKVVMTSKEIYNPLFLAYLNRNGITSFHYDEIIERFRDNKKFLILEVKI